jgi:glycosyltransferase involved in cell wall biosynthesis
MMAQRIKQPKLLNSLRTSVYTLYSIQKTRGVSAARNTAMKHAKGKWFALLDADDEWLSERLEKLMKILFESGNDYFIGDDHLICFDTPSGLKPRGSAFKLGHLNISFNSKGVVELSLLDFLKAGSATIVHMIFPAESVKKYGLQFKIGLSYAEDFEFYCQLFRIGLKLKLYKEPLYLYRLTPESITGNPNIWDKVNILELFSSDKRFTPDERNLFKEKIRNEKKRALYKEFTYMLKRRKFSKANRLLLKHPSLLIKLLYALPHSLRYRLAAKKAGGRIK